MGEGAGSCSVCRAGRLPGRVSRQNARCGESLKGVPCEDPVSAAAADERVSLYTPRRPSLREYVSPAALRRDLWSHRHLIWLLSRRSTQQLFRGSWLGFSWTLLRPVLLLLIYTFVFGIVFRAHWGVSSSGSRFEFAVALFCGLLVFGIFAECAGAAPSLVMRQASYVKRIVFPLQILPVVTLGSVLMVSAFGFVILLAGLVLLRGGLPVTLVWLPLVLLASSLLALAAGWLLAAGGVFLRDLEQGTAVAVTMLYFATPIFYPLAAVPEPYRRLLLLNPLTLIVESARDAVVWGRTPRWDELGLLTLGAAVAALLAYAVFMKAKRGFADVL